MNAKEAFLETIGIGGKKPASAKEAFVQALDAEPPKDKIIKMSSNPSEQGEKTLAEHAPECTAKSPETCPYVRKMAEQAQASGMSAAKAKAWAIQQHQLAAQGKPTEGQEGYNPNEGFDKNAQQVVQEMVQNPEAFSGWDARMLPEPVNLNLDVIGAKIKVETTEQVRSVLQLSDAAAAGDQKAIDELERLSTRFGVNARMGGKEIGTHSLNRDNEPYEPKPELLGELKESVEADRKAREAREQQQSQQQTSQEQSERQPAPPDSEFATENPDEFQVGDNTYVDVSKKGFWEGIAAAWKAGWEGKDIVTGWDRISGKWDKIKAESPARNNVRDAILGASFLSDLEGHMMDENLSNDARLAVSLIKEMYENAATTKDKLKAIKEYQKWKKANGIESGETNKPAGASGRAAQSMDAIHQDGGVLGSKQRVDNEGNIVSGGEADNRKPPSANILGNPGFVKSDGSVAWNANPEIKDLEKKKATALDVLKNHGIQVSGGEATTSFNSTFVRFNIVKPIPDREADKIAEEMAFGLGCKREDLSVSVDNKTKQLVVGLKNEVQGDVSTKEIMETDEWKNAVKTMRCPIIIGRTDDGKPLIRDMKDVVHILVAGDTGNGKSVAMNTILCSMLMAKKPDELKTVLIDLKQVELTAYKDSAHNAVPVATDIESAMKSLDFVKTEMENRQRLIEAAGCRNIDEYNAKAKAEGKDTLPTMVLAIDELTEVRKAGGQQFDDTLHSIGNLGRASGIHLICATQEPTKKNIGPIKSDFPTRLAFRVNTREGSEAILNDKRAMGLQRKGQFIFEDQKGESRGQGSAMGHGDERRVVEYWNTGKEDAGTGPSQRKPAPAPAPKPASSETSAENPTAAGTAEAPASTSTTTSESASGTTAASGSTTAESSSNSTISKEDSIKYAKEEFSEGSKELDEKLRNKQIRWSQYQKEKKKLRDTLEASLAAIEEEYKAPSQGEGEGTQAQTNATTAPTTSGTTAAPAKPESPFEALKTPEARKKRAYDDAMAEIKRISKENKGNPAARQKAIKAAEERYNRIVKAIDDGKSDEDIQGEFDKEKKEADDRDAALKATVVTQRKGKPIPGATPGAHRGNDANITKLNKQELARVQNADLPEGFEVDIDPKFNAPVKDGTGKTWVRHPTNGSYGYVDANGKFKMVVNTTHPSYKGSNSAEAKAAKEAVNKAMNDTPDDPKVDDLIKTYNNIAYGIDQAPDGLTLIDNAIAYAIAEG